MHIIWTATSEFGTYSLCEQWRFRRACASAQSRQNLRCSHIQAVNQEEPSDRKPDPWPLWTAGHAQLKFVMTECSKTQIRLTGPICPFSKTVHHLYHFIHILCVLFVTSFIERVSVSSYIDHAYHLWPHKYTVYYLWVGTHIHICIDYV